MDPWSTPHITRIDTTRIIQWRGSQWNIHWIASSKSSTNVGCAYLPIDPNPRARVSSMHHLIHACQHTKNINDDILHSLWHLAPTMTSYTHFDINDIILNDLPLCHLCQHTNHPDMLHKLPFSSCFFSSILSNIISPFDINEKVWLGRYFH